MGYDDKEIREIFHFLFLDHLLRISDPKLYVLKGGVNLRFFFQSPRYSEDMDLDVLGGSVATLKKNGYKILESAAFKRILQTYGIKEIILNDPGKAKQTETTQRFRVRLINSVDEEFPTKIEFSRRPANDIAIDHFEEDNIDPKIAGYYKRLSFRCQHYPGYQAVIQKIKALAGRPQTQARDVFDLYLLYIGNHFDSSRWNLKSDLLSTAIDNAMSITFEQYHDQVVEYLDIQGKRQYSTCEQWENLRSKIVDELS